MCTVTYVPNKENGFVLTSNRDEAPERSATIIKKVDKEGYTLFFPQDKGAGGSWIAMDDRGRLICLLNGGFVKHKHQPPYKKSRGVMVLEYFDFATGTDFLAHYDFLGMEPFTLVICDEGILRELIWDGEAAYINRLDENQSHIWASATLYNEEWKNKRKQWLMDWQQKYPHSSPSDIWRFHHEAGEGNVENDVVMNRNEIVKTIGVTQVIRNQSNLQLKYEDLVHGTTIEEYFQYRDINVSA